MRDSRKYEVSSVKRHGKLGLDSACQHNSPSSFFIFSVANKIIERASRIFDVTYLKACPCDNNIWRAKVICSDRFAHQVKKPNNITSRPYQRIRFDCQNF